MATWTRMKSILDALATAMMLVASIALVWLVVTVRAERTETKDGTRITASEVGYSIGEPFEAPAPSVFADGSTTLILFLRSGCQYCTDSMQFYRELVAQAQDVRIVVMGPEPESVLRTYLQAHQLAPDAVVSVQRQQVRFSGTPTLVLTGSDRVVQAIWRGRLAPAKELEVRSRIR